MELLLHEDNEVISELKPEYNESVSAEEGKTFVIATIEIANVGDRSLQLERSQWRLVDTNGQTHYPHEAAMTRGADTVPTQTALRPDETAEYRVIVEVRNPTNVTYIQDPIIGSDAPTIRVEPPA